MTKINSIVQFDWQMILENVLSKLVFLPCQIWNPKMTDAVSLFRSFLYAQLYVLIIYVQPFRNEDKTLNGKLLFTKKKICSFHVDTQL